MGSVAISTKKHDTKSEFGRKKIPFTSSWNSVKKVHLVNGEGNIILIRSLMTSLITPFGSSDPVVVS